MEQEKGEAKCMIHEIGRELGECRIVKIQGGEQVEDDGSSQLRLKWLIP